MLWRASQERAVQCNDVATCGLVVSEADSLEPSGNVWNVVGEAGRARREWLCRKD